MKLGHGNIHRVQELVLPWLASTNAHVALHLNVRKHSLSSGVVSYQWEPLSSLNRDV